MRSLTGNEVAKQCHIVIRDMVVDNVAVSTLSNVIFRQQILLEHVELSAIGGSRFPFPRL